MEMPPPSLVPSMHKRILVEKIWRFRYNITMRGLLNSKLPTIISEEIERPISLAEDEAQVVVRRLWRDTSRRCMETIFTKSIVVISARRIAECGVGLADG